MNPKGINFTKAVNFRSDCEEAHKFGHRLENGSWTGMISELKEEKKDVAIGPFDNILERFFVIRFLRPFHFEWFDFQVEFFKI